MLAIFACMPQRSWGRCCGSLLECESSYARKSKFDHPGKPSANADGALKNPSRLGVASRDLARRFNRSPSAYLSASWATAAQARELLFPTLRPQVFVRATKVRSADFAKHFPHEIECLLLNRRANAASAGGSPADQLSSWARKDEFGPQVMGHALA